MGAITSPLPYDTNALQDVVNALGAGQPQLPAAVCGGGRDHRQRRGRPGVASRVRGRPGRWHARAGLGMGAGGRLARQAARTPSVAVPHMRRACPSPYCSEFCLPCPVVTAHRPTFLAALPRAWPPACQARLDRPTGPSPSTRERSLSMSAHEAGALHSSGYGGIAMVPAWLRPPADINELLPPAVGADGAARRGRGARGRRGGRAGPGRRVRHARPTCWTRPTSGAGRWPSATRSATAFAGLGGADVYYAGKAFLCTEVARWIAGRRAAPGHLLRRRARGRAARRGARPSASACTATTSQRRNWTGPCSAGIGRIVIDSLPEIDRVADAAGQAGVRAPVLLRVTVGVEAHTHEYIATAHEDQKFGISLSAGAAAEAVRRVLARPELELRGLHSHIGSQIFDTSGFEVAARRLLGLHAQVAREHGVAAARDRPGRRLRHRLHQRARPAGGQGAGRLAGRDRRPGSASPWGCRCRGSRSSRAGPSPGRPPSPCTAPGRSRTSRWSTARCAATSRSTAA